ncbi:MAG: HDIG domain-containing protein [Bacteroidales bacterium]|nr:HDIG domain-containing protein [Bacteroidales bacterium]
MKLPKFSKEVIIALELVAVAALMYILYPSKVFFQYNYQIGSPWTYETLVAPFDFPILKTNEQLLDEREQRASQIIEYYNYNDATGTAQINAFQASVPPSANDTLRIAASIVAMRMSDIYEKGLIPVTTKENSEVIFVKKEKRAKETPVVELYNVEGAYYDIYNEIAKKFNSATDSICDALKVKSYLVPNLTFDEKTTNAIHREAVEYISPTLGTIYTGQLIVSNGEIVTADVYQLLESFKAEYNNSYGISDINSSYKVGIIILIITILGLLLLNMLFTDEDILTDNKKRRFILCLFVLFYIALSIFTNLGSSISFMVPFPLIVLYTQAFFKKSFVFPNYCVFLLPLLFIPENGIKLFAINFAAGSVLLLAYPQLNRGWKQFLNVIILFAVSAFVYYSFTLRGSHEIFRYDFIYLAINALLVIICYPIVFLLEKLFSLVSNFRLWELSDTNNQLLQELSLKAPGTFQHSMQVASIAEDACRKINANGALVKVGALYHDIGKMMNPTCFVENQTSQDGESYHKDRSPKESAADIIHHVTDGCDIARKGHLPEIIVDFILTHHGTDKVTYFYNQYVNQGGDPADVDDFTYPGKKPDTKEEAVLMLADSVEAASRTLKEHKEENIRHLVNSIIQKKIDDGQLSVADISLKEIDAVRECFISHLLQIYHGRIEYPKLKRRSKNA